MTYTEHDDIRCPNCGRREEWDGVTDRKTWVQRCVGCKQPMQVRMIPMELDYPMFRTEAITL